MTSIYHFEANAQICDWLIRVNTQYNENTPEQIKAADCKHAEQTLQESKIYNFFFSSPRPAYSGFNIGNSRTTNNTYHTTNIYHERGSSTKSEDENTKDTSKKKKIQEPKTDWKGIAAVGVASTAIAGISLFVYARLSKATEGAKNYLENTLKVQRWAEELMFSKTTAQITQIARMQVKIDQRAMDKVTNYKYSILTSLVGTLAMASGGITILASMPLFATAGTVAIIVGGALNSIAVMHAAYNCGTHWGDKEEGKKEFSKVKNLIPDLIKDFNPNIQFQNGEFPTQQSQGTPPSYDESQAIYNQRTNSPIYPDLSGFTPSAPSYELLSK